MRRNRAKNAGLSALRKALLCVAILACPLSLAPAAASFFLPDNYFADKPVSAGQNMSVEADSLEYNDTTDIVIARGQVRMFYDGYAITADLVTYDQNTGSVQLEGNVRVRQPDGTILLADHADLSDDFKMGFIRSLKVEIARGGFISANSAQIEDDVIRTYEKATYAPCGICLENPKVPVGWRIKAVKIVQNDVEQNITFTHATLEVLGVPIMWIPYMSLPYLYGPKLSNTDFLHTRLSFSDKLGVGLETTLPVIATKDYSLIFTPRLLSKQGLLMSVQWEQLLEAGSYHVNFSIISQIKPSEFGAGLGNRKSRASSHTAGVFDIAPDWVFGWDYTRFSDAAFFDDYDLSNKGSDTVNRLYVQHFTQTTSFSAMVYEDILLGEVVKLSQDKQVSGLPVVDYDHYFDLDNEAGRVTVKANLVVLKRNADDVSTTSGIAKVHGFAGEKQHARAEISWKKQWIAPGGVLVTPYLGLRADWAQYDGGSSHPSAPAIPSLTTATPIAALDVRWPLGGRTENASILLEPIFQIVARSGSQSRVGITNDTSQGLSFDNTNLFSYERFAGFDRQETGVRTNYGVRYSMTMDDGGWYEATLGQSVLLSGTNAFAVADPSLVGVGTGLETKNSDIVAGFTSKPVLDLTLSGQINLKSSDLSVRRSTVSGTWQKDAYSASARYSMVKAEAGLGVTDDLHALELDVGFPLAQDYSASLNYSFYKAAPSVGVTTDQKSFGGSLNIAFSDYISGSLSSQYDLDDNSFSKNSIGLKYDDGYVRLGANYTRTGPTATNSPNQHLVGLHFSLRQ